MNVYIGKAGRDNTVRLPDAYQEVEYIQSSASGSESSSSGQYIDTLFTPTPNTKISIDMQFTSTSPTQQRLFGCDTSNSSYMTFAAYINGSTQRARAVKNGEGNWQSTNVSADTTRHTFELDNSTYKIYTNGTQIHSSSNGYTSTTSCQHTLPLLANYSNAYGKIAWYASAKLYGCKIRNSGSLVREFVPCYRKSDNAIGLYDMVGGTFYGNSGSGSFTKGAKKGEKFSDIYQQVEYIESDGNQYLDSGYNPNNNTKISCKFAHNEHTMDTPVFGARSSGGYNQFVLWSHPTEYGATTGSSQCRFNDTSHSMSDYSQGTAIEFEYDKNGGKYGSQTWTWSTSSGTPNVNLVVLGLREGSSVDPRRFSGKLRYFKIRQNGILVRDFVPCYRKSDNVAGMFDFVNNIFYTNQGSGSFTVGPTVSRNTLIQGYIGYYQTGWRPGENTLLYYPLTSDLVDVMGNGNTGTAHGTPTFNPNPGSTTGIYVHGGSSKAYVTGMSMGMTGRNTGTLNFRANFISMDGSSSTLVGRWGAYGYREPIKLIGETGQQLGCKFPSGNYYTDTNSSYPNNYIALNTGFHNFGFSLDNGVLYMYVDGQPITYKGGQTGVNAGTIYNTSGYNALCLGRTNTGDYRDTAATGYIRDYIVETVPWSDTDFLRYYNQTKSKFGL